MRNVSTAFLRALAGDKRDYKSKLIITLANNTTLTIENEQIWDNGLEIQDSVSSDNVFQIGAAIINQGTFVLNNIYGDFDEYSFDEAVVVAYTGLHDLDDGSNEEIKLGTFIVDEAKYNGSIITLTCFDNMSKFDKVYDSTQTYPATLFNIVSNACSQCGVTLDNSSLNFPHKDYIVTDKPSGDNTTYRQLISWAAQIAGCFARCNADGKLELRWFNTGEFDNALTGVDGGVFDGTDADWLSDYINTETGMTALSSARVDDQWFRIDNAIGFEFGGSISDYLYIASNSRYEFANSTPGSSTNTSYDVNICGRDGQSLSIKYQVITVGTKEAIKVRFSGYTKYAQADQLPQNALVYEIFFTNTGAIIVNFITIPSDSSALGTTSIIENSVTSTFTPSTTNPIILYRGSGSTWTAQSTFTDSYTSGDDADGGTFEPWSTGDEYDGGTFNDFDDLHFISSCYSADISTDDVVITGVKVIKKLKDDGSNTVYNEYTSGTSGYVIIIENNEFIDGDHGQDVANWLGTLVNGLTFRKADLTHPNDPSIEAGDVAIYWDRSGRGYPILVSSTTFSVGNSQRTVSSAETPKKNSSQRFNEATRNYVEIRKMLKAQRSDFEVAEEALAQRIDNAGGLYCTEVTENGATKTYYHNKPLLAESDIRMLFSDVGFTLTADGGDNWYGMTVDGTMIAAILNASGVNADWINSGAIYIEDANSNETFYADTATGAVRINANSFALQGDSIEDIAKDVTPKNWYQSENPANSWNDNATRAKHVGDQWYCESETDAIPTWLTTYVNTEENMTALSSSYADDVWYSISNSVGFEFEGAASTYLYISSNSRFGFSDTSGLSSVTSKIEIFGRDGSSVSIKYQTITNGTNQAIKVRFEGYTRYGSSNQTSEYALEYEIFFTNGHKIYLNMITTPSNSNYLGTTRIADNGTNYSPSETLAAGDHVSAIKGSSGWEFSISGRYAGKTWQYMYRNSQYVWREKVALGSQSDVFNRLTNNGAAQGIFMENGQLYISFSYARGGTLKLGGASNGNGVLEIYNSSGTKIATIDNTGISVSNDKFKVDVNGNVTAMSMTAYGSLVCYENYTIT